MTRFQVLTKKCAKVQLILKTDWRAIDSPKKRMDEFVFLS